MGSLFLHAGIASSIKSNTALTNMLKPVSLCVSALPFTCQAKKSQWGSVMESDRVGGGGGGRWAEEEGAGEVNKQNKEMCAGHSDPKEKEWNTRLE